MNTNAQYSATLKLPVLDFISLNPGDDVIIPVILNNKTSGSLISYLDFYISFDHSFFSWKGTSGNPTLGVQNFHPNMPYSLGSWTFNDDGIEIHANWFGENAINMNNGDTFFEYIFTYNGGLNPGDSSLLIWGTFYKNGFKVKGLTEMADQNFGNFNLSFINGRIIITGSTVLNLKVFLEGPYVNDEMAPYLNAPGVLPLSQPYNIAPWYYQGSESVISIPNNNIVDWILVELRETLGGAATAGPEYTDCETGRFYKG